MKIAFLNVPWWDRNESGLRQGIRAGSRWPFTKGPAHQPGYFKFGGYLPYPFFLGPAASYTKKLIPDAEIIVRDSIARGETDAEFTFALNKAFDWMVIETATACLDHDLRVVRYIGEKHKAKIILSGVIGDEHHQKILADHPNVHAIVKGEYDKQIAKAIKGPRGVYEHDLLTKEEMASPPFPMWDTECLTHYWDPCPNGQRAPQLQLWTSRGCPYKCCFCVFPATMTGNDPTGEALRSVRFHSPEYVEAYIRHMLNLTDYQSIYLDDDTFNLSKKHTLEICEVMKRIGLPWSAMCRADTIGKPEWQEMKDSGCFGVKIGFESGSQHVIDHIVNKRLDIAKAHDTCRWLQSIGMTVHTTWTVGLPGETNEQKQETLRMIDEMYADGSHTTHQLSGTSVIDGTPLDHIAKGEHLKKYDGATNEGFLSMPDGQKKIEIMGGTK